MSYKSNNGRKYGDNNADNNNNSNGNTFLVNVMKRKSNPIGKRTINR